MIEKLRQHIDLDDHIAQLDELINTLIIRVDALENRLELGNCPDCPNAMSLEEALEQNAKLRELVKDLYEWKPDDHPTIRNLHFYTFVRMRMEALEIELDEEVGE